MNRKFSKAFVLFVIAAVAMSNIVHVAGQALVQGESADGTYQFSYPAGWLIDEFPLLESGIGGDETLLASNQRMLDATRFNTQDFLNGVSVVMSIQSKAALQDGNLSAADLAQKIAAQGTGTVDTHQINNITIYSTLKSSTSVSQYFDLVDLDNNSLLLVAGASSTIDQYTDTIDALTASIQLVSNPRGALLNKTLPVVNPIGYTSSTVGIGLSAPSGWVFENIIDNSTSSATLSLNGGSSQNALHTIASGGQALSDSDIGLTILVKTKAAMVLDVKFGDPKATIFDTVQGLNYGYVSEALVNNRTIYFAFKPLDQLGTVMTSVIDLGPTVAVVNAFFGPNAHIDELSILGLVSSIIYIGPVQTVNPHTPTTQSASGNGYTFQYPSSWQRLNADDAGTSALSSIQQAFGQSMNAPTEVLTFSIPNSNDQITLDAYVEPQADYYTIHGIVFGTSNILNAVSGTTALSDVVQVNNDYYRYSRSQGDGTWADRLIIEKQLDNDTTLVIFVGDPDANTLDQYWDQIFSIAASFSTGKTTTSGMIANPTTTYILTAIPPAASPVPVQASVTPTEIDTPSPTITPTESLLESTQTMVANNILAATANQAGISGHWRLDDTTGNIASDSSGNEHPGLLQGAPTWKDFYGSGVALNGNGDFVQINGSVVNTSHSFSVSAEVQLDHTPSGSFSTAVSQDGLHVSGFYLQYSTSLGGKFAFAMQSDDSTGSTPNRAVSTTIPVIGDSYRIIGVFDAEKQVIKLYVNGALEGTEPFTTPWAASGNTIIGRGKWNDGPSDFWPGVISDVYTYDRVLSDGEIAKLQ